MKIAQAGVGAILSALLVVGAVHAQNVGIGGFESAIEADR